MKKIAIIGCGALAGVLAEAMQKCLAETYEICGFLGRTRRKAEDMAEKYNTALFESLEDMIQARPDYIVELAGGDAVREYAEKILSAGLNLIVASVGALADESFKTALEKAAAGSGAKLYVISGAIGGFDVMQTLSLMGPVKGTIRNEKAPRSLAGAPYLEKRPLNFNPDVEQTVFRGSVKDAIEGFPKNVNVAVASSLASGCPDMEVTIKSIPELTENCHTVHLEGDIVTVDLSIQSRPDPANPKSSTMTAWSIAALLKNLESPIVFF